METIEEEETHEEQQEEHTFQFKEQEHVEQPISN